MNEDLKGGLIANGIFAAVIAAVCVLTGVARSFDAVEPTKVCVSYKTEQYVDTSFNLGLYWFTGIPSISSTPATHQVCSEWVTEVPKPTQQPN